MFREMIGCVVLSVFLYIFRCVFLHRLPYCDHLRLSSCSARWYVPSSTSNARCPATGMDESAQEDHPYTSPTRELSASKSSLCRRHSIEVCPLGKPPVANSHHHVSRHYPGLPSTTLFATAIHDVELVLQRDLSSACAPSISWERQTHQEVGWLYSSALSCKSDPLIITVDGVFCTCRLCIGRHASALGLTPFMFS